MSTTNAPTIVNPEELTPYNRWTTEILYAEKELEKFHERAEKVNKRFVDERDAFDAGNKWFNLFYSNVLITKSALYAQLPKPDVRRKFLDYQDDVARVAANILQRCLQSDLDDPRDNFDSIMKYGVMDRLIVGLAVPWLRLETDTETRTLEVLTPPTPDAGDASGEPNAGFQTATANPQEPQTYEVITDQRVPIDYVFWKDFVWSPCRVWSECRWVGRKVYMSRDDLIKRFGDEKGKLVPLSYTPTPTGKVHGTTPKNMALQMAVVYEIWDRKNKKVVWYADGMTELLDEKDDPLKLVGFFPCPEPMLANVTTSNTVPRPDYYMIQDQYMELDTVNHRIAMLTKALKVVGLYDSSATGVQRMLQEGFDNDMIPVSNWAMFAEKGGIKGQVDWLPLEQIVQALQQLYLSREAIKQQIYELTGIADIVRGASKASETLGAQEIKAKFAGIRINTLQGEVARYASEILRIRAEIMVKHFDPQILVKKSGVVNTDDAQLVEPAMALLVSEEGFEWRITVTSDQMAQPDYEMEKQDRIELLSAVSGYLEKAMALVQAKPETAPLVINLLKWGVSSFRGAREIESMLDQALDAVIKQPVQKEPDPKVQAAQAKQKADEQKMQAEIQRDERKAQLEEQGMQQELEFKRQEGQISLMQAIMEMRVDMQKFQQQMQQDQQRFMQQMTQAAIQKRVEGEGNGDAD